MNTRYNILTTLLGIILGVLLTLLSLKPQEPVKFDGDYNRWRKLNLILQEVEKHYVDTIDMVGMTDAAVTAALAKLDPHSMYLPPIELTEADTELAGNFEGIGITFNVPNDTAIVLNTIPGGPSEKAGLIQGDRIIKVDDKIIAGTKTPQDSMIHLMKGPKGTKVKITVSRYGTQIPFDIIRDKIPVHCIDAAFMIDDETGYIKLSKFTKTTYQEFTEATHKLTQQGMKTLIFDLRNNSGGYFDQAYWLTNEFLNAGERIVYMEGLHFKREDHYANGRGRLKNLKLKILIDEGSASSSEIVAGAIQDNDRGIIIGRRSFGKGLVQEPIYFTDGSGVRLTVARFYTPSGRCIQKPYDNGYEYNMYDRYIHGELTSADSVKVDTSAVFYTSKGRKVYGGGGIIPDIFVPMDTTLATDFHINCIRKGTTMRFASALFDKHHNSLAKISNFEDLKQFLKKIDTEKQFLDFAANVDGVKPKAGEWEGYRDYLMPQIYGLVGRYSKVGEEAFYRFYLPIDETIQAALKE